MLDWNYWVNKAREYEEAGNYNEAINYYFVILEDNPEDTFALTNIGSCFSKAGQFNLAVTYLDKAIDIKPWDAYLWFNKGVVFFENNQYRQAITYFDKAISLNEDDYISWSFKGLCYQELMDIPKAIECFEISYGINHDETTLYFINELKQANPFINADYTFTSGKKQCPICGRMVNEVAVSCGFCGHRFVSSTGGDRSSSSGFGKKQCPSCGRMVNEVAVSCGFCGHTFGNETGIIKKCPNCGTAVRKNKKICPKCNYKFKKSRVDEPKNLKTCPNCGRRVNESSINCGFCGYSFNGGTIGGNKKVYPNSDKAKINQTIHIKHFDNDIVSFDYPDIYSKDYNSKYEKLDIIVSFKTGPQYDYDSAFAIFAGEPISDEIPDSKFKEAIKKSLDSDVLNIDRHSFGEKERIIIKAQNKTNGNTEYLCNIPEIGFSILFVIPIGKDYLFDEKWVSTIVDSLEESTGESVSKNEVLTKKEVKVCPNCGAENSDDSNFCIECGVKLDIAKDVNFCIHCGTEVVPGAKFCMNCGKLIED